MEELNAFFREMSALAAGKVISAVIFAVIGIFAIRILTKLLKRALLAAKLEKAAHTMILSLARVTLWLLLGLTVASALGIDITGIVALASVLTLAVSLSLQNMMGNVLGGLTLLSTNPFHTGDFVEIAGQSGTVEEIDMTYTRLITPDNKKISIPNSAVVAAQIVNYTASGTRRMEVTVSVGYETDPQKVLDALVIAGTADNVLLEPAPAAVLTGYGEHAIGYSLRCWAKNEDYWDAYFQLNQRVYTVFREQGIAFAAPRIQVQMKN